MACYWFPRSINLELRQENRILRRVARGNAMDAIYARDDWLASLAICVHHLNERMKFTWIPI